VGSGTTVDEAAVRLEDNLCASRSRCASAEPSVDVLVPFKAQRSGWRVLRLRRLFVQAAVESAARDAQTCGVWRRGQAYACARRSVVD
jgi:hypothetical protein